MSTSNITLKEAVEKALDEAQDRHKVNTDKELARIYGLSPKTISFLRTGRWTRTDKLLIEALVPRYAATIEQTT